MPRSKHLVNEGAVKRALADFERGQYQSLSQAADAHKVSKDTLRRRHKGVKPKAKAHLHRQLLIDTEEKLLCRWITELTDKNVPVRVGMLNSMASTII